MDTTRLVSLLAFAVTIGCISPFPDGSQGPRWALISLVPLIAMRAKVLLPWPAVAVILYLAVSVTWSPDPFSGADLVWHFAVLIVVAFIAPVNMTPVYWAMGLGLAANTVVVMLQLDGWDPVANVGLQATGLFFNRNQQNCFVALVIVGLLSIGFGPRLNADIRGPNFDWRALTLAIFCAIPLLTVPIERAPVLGLAAAGAFLICRRWPLMLPAVIALGAGLFLRLLDDPARLVALTSRIDTWADMAAGMRWLGNGLGSFQWTYPEMERAHNDLLQIAYELGAPGFLAAAVFLLYCIARGPVVPRLILIVFAVEGLFDFPLYQPATGFLAALAAGHLVRVRAPLLRSFARGQRSDLAREAQHRPA